MINYAYGYFLLLKTPLRPTEGGGGSNKTRGTPARARQQQRLTLLIPLFPPPNQTLHYSRLTLQQAVCLSADVGQKSTLTHALTQPSEADAPHTSKPRRARLWAAKAAHRPLISLSPRQYSPLSGRHLVGKQGTTNKVRSHYCNLPFFVVILYSSGTHLDAKRQQRTAYRSTDIQQNKCHLFRGGSISERHDRT